MARDENLATLWQRVAGKAKMRGEKTRFRLKKTMKRAKEKKGFGRLPPRRLQLETAVATSAISPTLTEHVFGVLTKFPEQQSSQEFLEFANLAPFAKCAEFARIRKMLQ